MQYASVLCAMDKMQCAYVGGSEAVTASSMCQFWGEGGVLASLNCPPLQYFEMLNAMHCTVNCNTFNC